jgi:acetylornithine deacetylase/succinyl-diaminopimelate desuccinylase-like protein
MPTPAAVLDHLAADEPAAIARLVDWLKIPSVSTDPAYRDDCRKAAQWAADQFRALGFTVELRETGSTDAPGHPIVWATTPGTGSGPHVLFYGHYDVQPADPLELWESAPFEPVVRDARPGEHGGRRVVARGAVDDKGQVMMFLEALRAWKHATGNATNNVRVTVLLEGEEESGSKNLDAFVRAHAADLKAAHFCLISDTGMLDRGQPAITYGVRGLAYTQITLHAANQDLHSGLWGGRCPNPNNELPKILARLWDKDRRVTIPGFYDAVRPLDPAERANWKKLTIDPAANLAKIGLPPEADIGESGYSATEREWARPTAEINGIYGGYTGAGAKTVIPAHASAKVSFRLVADQDPARITAAFFDWLRAQTPPGCRWELIDMSGGHPATCRVDSPYLQAAARAAEKAAGAPCALIKSGGSIPVAGMLKSLCGLDTVFMGFGLDDDRVHSPNEKFELDCFRTGARAHALLLGELAAM